MTGFRVVLPLPHSCATEGCRNDPGYSPHCTECQIRALSTEWIGTDPRPSWKGWFREQTPKDWLRHFGAAVGILAFLMLAWSAVLVEDEEPRGEHYYEVTR